MTQNEEQNRKSKITVTQIICNLCQTIRTSELTSLIEVNGLIGVLRKNAELSNIFYLTCM